MARIKSGRTNKVPDKKKKLGFKHIIKNNLYMLKMIHETDRFLIPIRISVSILSAVISFLSSSYLLKYALNAVSDGKEFFEVVWLIIAFVAANLIYTVIINLYEYFYKTKRYYAVRKKINEAVFKKAREVELACYEDPVFYDDFVKGSAETDERAFAVLQSLADIINTIVSLVLGVGLIMSVHWVFLIFCLIPLAAAPIKAKVNKKMFERDNKIHELDRKKGYPSRVFYVPDYAKELRLTNIGTYLLKYLREASEMCREVHRKDGTVITWLQVASTFLVDILSIALATVYAVYRTVVTKLMGYGDCIAVLNVSSQISDILVNSTEYFGSVYSNALFVDNLRKFLEYEPKLKDGDKELPSDGDIEFKNVSFKYPGAEKNVLNDVSMSFGRNEKVAIVGTNGAGKSTIVKLLLRLYDCEGSITYGDVDIKELNIDDYRGVFSSVMQDYHMFALTAAENVMLHHTTDEDNEAVINALKKAGVYKKIEDGGGINSIMTKEFDENGIMLSGGQTQKLAISHVYSKRNKFVILDEPSSALDPIAEYEMYETMLDACHDCGMIFISHRLSSATLADKVYLIENGRVIEQGSHHELMALGGKYAEMFNRQAESYKKTEGEVNDCE